MGAMIRSGSPGPIAPRGTGLQGRRLHPAGLGVDERLPGLQRSHGGVPVEEGFRHQRRWRARSRSFWCRYVQPCAVSTSCSSCAACVE